MAPEEGGGVIFGGPAFWARASPSRAVTTNAAMRTAAKAARTTMDRCFLGDSCLSIFASCQEGALERSPSAKPSTPQIIPPTSRWDRKRPKLFLPLTVFLTGRIGRLGRKEPFGGRHLRDADTAEGREKEHFTTETQSAQREESKKVRAARASGPSSRLRRSSEPLRPRVGKPRRLLL